MRNHSVWILAVVMGAGLAGAVKLGMTAGSQPTATEQIKSAAFRDGSYLGKLDAQHGIGSHLAVGRWTTDGDRNLFAAGYEEAYGQNAASGDRGDVAAFRDGLYLGKLDAERGNSLHLAVGRWVTDGDRSAFAQGYNLAYDEVNSARSEQSSNLRQALLTQ